MFVFFFLAEQRAVAAATPAAAYLLKANAHYFHRQRTAVGLTL